MFGKRSNIWLLLIVLCWGCESCTSRAVHDAESVVAQADSLRAEGKMYGIDEGDSTSLAQAYEALKKYSEVSRQFSEICPFVPCTSSLCTYAPACYHYGRLLREKDNPVAAMECFINATHSRTRDYHILGRVYSNMGEIAHLASDFSLSYDMFERSGDMFLRSGDTTSYYHCLNRMAFELAEQGKKEETLELLRIVETQCLDKGVLNQVIETKVVLYEIELQQDSVIYYSTELLNRGYKSATILLNRAKAYSFKGEKDSAVYYAGIVLSMTDELYDLNNALYILTNDDTTKNSEAIKETAANRADVQKIIEDKRSKTAQAVQLLEQDLNRKPDWWWLYAIIAFILFAVSLAILYYILRKRKQHRELIMDLREKEEEQSHLENTLNNLSQLQETKHFEIQKEAEEVCQLLGNSSDIRAELCWNNYEQMCTTVNLRLFGIIDRLQSFSLSEKEMRLCVLVLLQASTEQMVDMIPYARSGIGKLKYTTARKLGTTTSVMRSFILNLMG